jgi:excisionase family DNA binding protein
VTGRPNPASARKLAGRGEVRVEGSLSAADPKPTEDREALLGALVELAGRLALANLSGRLALRPREAAEALGISERKLRELLGRIPHVRLDGVLLFPVDALRAWLAAQARTSNGNPAEALAKRALEAVGR